MTDTTETTRKQAAANALAVLSSAIRGPRGSKKAERDAAKAERRDARKATLLEVLNTGITGNESQNGKWSARLALTKAVSAVKNGATADELQACTALRAVAPWATLGEPVRQYAEAKDADVATVLAGLGCAETEPATTDPTEQAADAPEAAPKAASETEAPKAQAKPKTATKGRQGRAKKGS